MKVQAPYSLYLSVLILNRRTNEEIRNEIHALGLPIPDTKEKEWTEALLKSLRSSLPKVPSLTVVSKTKKRTANDPVREWMTQNHLPTELLNLASKRVQAARLIAETPQIAEVLNVSLLNPSLSWEGILSSLSIVGKVRGLKEEMVRDYQQLFWNFLGFGIQQKRAFLRRIDPSIGTIASMEGRTDVGLALSIGTSLQLSDLQVVGVMHDLTFLKFVRDMYAGQCKALDASVLTKAVLDLQERMQRLRPPDRTQDVEFSGSTETRRPPSLEDLSYLMENDEEEDSGNEQTAIVPFKR